MNYIQAPSTFNQFYNAFKIQGKYVYILCIGGSSPWKKKKNSNVFHWPRK